jgi:hypothetical protein
LPAAFSHDATSAANCLEGTLYASACVAKSTEYL